MFRLCFAWLLVPAASVAGAAEPHPLVSPAHRVAPEDPAWKEWLAMVERRPRTLVSEFEERRHFAFKKTATVLKGEARVSAEHGLSLHYLAPEGRIVIIDDRGLLIRERGRDVTPPADSRAAAANAALLHLLRFNLHSLAASFEIYGQREGIGWSLALVPRLESVRRSVGIISVSGEAARVSRIELRRSATQRVEILIAPPRAADEPFTPEELKRFFR